MSNNCHCGRDKSYHNHVVRNSNQTIYTSDACSAWGIPDGTGSCLCSHFSFDPFQNVQYWECHITIEPVFDERLELFKMVIAEQDFRAADLVMIKSRAAKPERSNKDTFCTGRSKDFNDLNKRMQELCNDLEIAGFKVWRNKIEAIIIDERHK